MRPLAAISCNATHSTPECIGFKLPARNFHRWCRKSALIWEINPVAQRVTERRMPGSLDLSQAGVRDNFYRKEAKTMEETQRQKLAELFAQQHVAVIVTQGEEWATATLQAFAETPELDLLFIMGETAEKFQNLVRQPKVTVIIDNRDVGDVNTFRVSRSVVQGIAGEVARGAEWDSLKDIFLKKNPFEAPFFGMPALRMVRVKPKRISYTGADRQGFKIQL
jgi:hypothetical protein